MSIMWTGQDLAALWGWVHAPEREAIPYEERCWRCESRRIHLGCAADLCESCCEDLKATDAA